MIEIQIPDTLNDDLKLSIEVKNNFNKIRTSYKTFLEGLSKDEYLHLISNEFNVQEAKIAHKLLNFPGDISPTMLVKFGEALTRYKNIIKEK